MNSIFSGVICPLLTPLSDDGSSLDEDRLRRLVDALIGDGINGLIACGTTGEFSALSAQERERVAVVTIEHAANRVPVMVQTGSTSTFEAIRLSKHAAEHGAAGLLLPPPYYGSHTDDEVETFYRAVAAETDLPICLYNIPSATGIGMSLEFMVALAEKTPTISYLKDSSGDILQQAVVLKDHTNQLTLLCGEELLLAPGLMLGMGGAVVGCANFLSTGLVKLMEAGANGDFVEMASLNAALTAIMRFIVTHSYTATIKHAMDYTGISTGPVREPLLPLSSTDRAELECLIQSLDPTLLIAGAHI